MDRIDYNIQNVATSVEEGFKQLQKVIFSFPLTSIKRVGTWLVLLEFVR